jgi:type I restriction enzyme R subunit
MAFNEDSRVKIPALLHLTRLGFSYLSLKDLTWDESTNIFPTLFRDIIGKINPGASSWLSARFSPGAPEPCLPQ